MTRPASLSEQAASLIRESLEQCAIPEHMHDGVIHYLLHGYPPGDFLHALLSNDLMEAFGRADLKNIDAMKRWATWLYNYAPAAAWGSPEKVQKWMERTRAARAAQAEGVR